MQKAIMGALVVAAVSGIAVGLQGTLNNWAGRLVGATGTGLLVNFVGGAAAGVLLLLLVAFGSGRGVVEWGAFRGAAPAIILASGLLGIAIITGVAYSLPRVGVAAGLSAVILGQMVVAVVVDSLGWAGDGSIPLSAARIAGLALLLLGTWLLLPRR